VARVSDPRAGAVVTFLGVTRQVAELDYEAYVPMAERQMEQIVAAAIEEHGLCAAAAEHRVGAVRCQRHRWRSRRRPAPRRGVRRRAADHRPDQGAGADLEEGGGRVGERHTPTHRVPRAPSLTARR